VQIEEIVGTTHNTMSLNRAIRRKWVPIIKTLISSAVDVAGDWVFLIRTKSTIGLDKYEIPMFVFCVFASLMTVLTYLSVLMRAFSTSKTSDGVKKANRIISIMLVGEMFLEDIPQFVITALITSEKNDGVLSPAAVFNITTSGFNFFFNILDVLFPLEDEEELEDDGGEEEEADKFEDNLEA
jgi:hypothetical protein